MPGYELVRFRLECSTSMYLSRAILSVASLNVTSLSVVSLNVTSQRQDQS